MWTTRKAMVPFKDSLVHIYIYIYIWIHRLLCLWGNGPHQGNQQEWLPIAPLHIETQWSKSQIVRNPPWRILLTTLIFTAEWKQAKLYIVWYSAETTLQVTTKLLGCRQYVAIVLRPYCSRESWNTPSFISLQHVTKTTCDCVTALHWIKHSCPGVMCSTAKVEFV